MKLTATVKQGKDQWGSLAPQARKGGAAGLRQAAELLVDEAKQRAPVATGFLRDSIAVNEESETQVEVLVGADYAAYVELGVHGRSAQPFLVPAADYVESVYGVFIGNAIREALEKH